MPYVRPDGDRVAACPECDGAGEVYERQDPNDLPYACHKCGATFIEPVYREARTWTPGASNGDEMWQAHRRKVLGLEDA